MLAPSRPTSLLRRPTAMADAVARVVSAMIIGGSVVYTAHTIGGSLRGSANKLADAVAEIADTLSNGPRKPRLLHWVTGRADSGCAARRPWCCNQLRGMQLRQRVSSYSYSLQPCPSCSWVLAFRLLSVCLLAC